MKDMQDLQWLASEIEDIHDIPTLNRIIQTSQGIPAILADSRIKQLQRLAAQTQGARALAQGQQPPVMAQIKGQAAQQEAARQQAQMQQLAALQASPEMGLAALPYDEEDEESPEYQSTEDEGAEEGEGAAMGGLVALAQGGPVDGQDEKDFGDKYMDAVMAPLQAWRKIYGLAHGGPVRGFNGEEESYVNLDPERDATGRLMGPASDVREGEFLTPKESDFNYFKPWPSETEGYPKKHIPTAKDYYEQATGAVSDIWDTMKRGASQMADVKVRKDEAPKQVSEFLPSVRRADEPSAVKRVEQTAEPETTEAVGWNPPQIAGNDDPWSMGLRSLGTTPLRPGKDSTSPWEDRKSTRLNSSH